MKKNIAIVIVVMFLLLSTLPVFGDRTPPTTHDSQQILYQPLNDLSDELSQEVLVRINTTKEKVDIPKDGEIVSGSPGKWLDVILPQTSLQELTNAHLEYTVLISDVESYSDNYRGQYHTLAQIEQTLQNIATTYPTITRLTTIGTTYEGRTIKCLEISDNPGVAEGEPGVLFMGLHHAREWPTVEICLYIANQLTTQYGSNSSITNLVNNRRIWIVPCTNPDGYYYCHDQSHDWRKNRHYFSQFSSYGVDTNRNYDGSCNGEPWGAWGSIGPASNTHNPSSEIYVGPSAFSEAETQAIRNLTTANDICADISWHTYGEEVMWPWGYSTSARTPDNAYLTQIGQGIASQIKKEGGIGTYSAYQSAYLYPTTGDSDDWLYGYSYYTKGKPLFSYTIESGSEFQAPAGALDQICTENFDGALYLLQQAQNIKDTFVPPVLPPLMNDIVMYPDGRYNVSWTERNPDANPSQYQLQELTDFSTRTDNAESDSSLWTLNGYTLDGTRFYSGSMSYKSRNINSDVSCMTSVYPLPVIQGMTLSFWCWYNTENRRDYTFVEVSRNNGRTYDILDAYTGSSSGWKQKQYSLSSYVNESITIRFRSTTDTSTLVEGFYVDDISPVPDFDTVKTLSDSIVNHYYIVPGNPVGQYYYRVEGYNSRGWGDYSKTKMINAQFSAHPPYIPSNPNPENNSIDINVSMNLSWDGGDMDRSSIVYYNVSFGTTNPPSFTQRIGPYPGNQTRITYDPGNMNTYTQYYWQILADDIDPASNNTISPIWMFRSEDNLQPQWRNQGQSFLSIPQGENISLYAQGKDNVALKKAWLATNETGVWLNYSGDGWWNNSWDYCRTIYINHTKVGGDLTNFPVLVSCTSSDFINHAQPDGDDFLFADATNTTQYNHEIEYYNSATGELAAWVKIPFLSSTQDTVLYMYYGNAGCGSQQNVAGTWDSNFILVDHLTGATSVDLKDSSANHWDVTSSGGNPTYNQIGKVGRCVDFDGIDDYLQTNLFRLPTDSSYTASAWVYADGNAATRRYIFEGASENIGISLLVWTNETFKNYAKTDSEPTASLYSTTTVNVNSPQWYYVTTRVNAVSDDLDLLVNSLIEQNMPITGLVNPEPNGLNIGTYRSAGGYCMNGKIDEVRISNMARNDNWIKTEYNNMISPSLFTTIGAEIGRGGGWKHGSPVNLTSDADEWVWSNFTWQNSDIPAGRQIGWRIYYMDTSRNKIATDIMSFTIASQPQNNPPYVPSNPSPGNGLTGVSINADLSWVGGDPDVGDSVTYDVYFEAGDSTPDVLVSNDQPGTSYDPGTMGYSVTYYWQIVSTDNHLSSTPGPIWSFTTEAQPIPPAPTQAADITAWHTFAADLYKGIGGYPAKQYTYQSTSTETGNDLYFTFYWGDGNSTLIGPVTGSASASYAYGAKYGTYSITATVKHGPSGPESNPSTARSVRMFKLGDCNNDNKVTFADIDPFVAMLGSHATYVDAHPDQYWFSADCNLDNSVTFADIDPFVALLGS